MGQPGQKENSIATEARVANTGTESVNPIPTTSRATASPG